MTKTLLSTVYRAFNSSLTTSMMIINGLDRVGDSSKV